WFLRKSINLYGESFVKTLAMQKAQKYNLENGLELVKDFWVSKGIKTSGLQLMDGSGLSPQNRVTTKALVQVLQYSSTRDWYPAFYNALPEYNGMKMKSGSIGGSRAFAGYHTARDGKKYVFAFIINNYTGSSGDVVKKMYRVLDVLK
ncbi:MAG TPA: D-alanyl-D-alanine carboxypeptidase, partial [Flavitalea sp.]|nr:D-alanyl-D-alanine carboxypeptidase [Flavitalea sp.]